MEHSNSHITFRFPYTPVPNYLREVANYLGEVANYLGEVANYLGEVANYFGGEMETCK